MSLNIQPFCATYHLVIDNTPSDRHAAQTSLTHSHYDLFANLQPASDAGIHFEQLYQLLMFSSGSNGIFKDVRFYPDKKT